MRTSSRSILLTLSCYAFFGIQADIERIHTSILLKRLKAGRTLSVVFATTIWATIENTKENLSQTWYLLLLLGYVGLCYRASVREIFFIQELTLTPGAILGATWFQNRHKCEVASSYKPMRSAIKLGYQEKECTKNMPVDAASFHRSHQSIWCHFYFTERAGTKGSAFKSPYIKT